MAYYNKHDLQPVHAADAWNLDRYLFTAVAYLARAGKKEGAAYEDDVLKALWFLAYSVTKNTKHADEVLSTCKNLLLEDDNENEKTERHQLPVHVRPTNDTGNVSQYTVDSVQEEPKLVRERSDKLLHSPFADRVTEWLKGAIE